MRKGRNSDKHLHHCCCPWGINQFYVQVIYYYNLLPHRAFLLLTGRQSDPSPLRVLIRSNWQPGVRGISTVGY